MRSLHLTVLAVLWGALMTLGVPTTAQGAISSHLATKGLLLSPNGSQAQASKPKLLNTSLSLDKLSDPSTKKTATKDADHELKPLPSWACQDPQSSACAGAHPVSKVIGLVLNIFLPFAIGSWATGDFYGGFIGLFGQLGGVGLMLIGQFVAQGFLTPVGALIWVIGIVVASAGYIIPLFTVLFRSRRSYSLAPPTSPKQDYYARGMKTQPIPVVRTTF